MKFIIWLVILFQIFLGIHISNSVESNYRSEDNMSYMNSQAEAETEILIEQCSSDIGNFVLVNKTKSELSYNDIFYIEKKVNDEWQKLDFVKRVDSDLVLYKLAGSEKRTLTINFNFCYGGLEKGLYRLTKQINGKTVSVEFEI